MAKILRRVKNKVKRLFQWKPTISPMDNIIRIGTQYGGWAIPNNLLNEKSICYLAGAGEDISFDVGLVENYKSQIQIFDPTPRAKKHFDLLIESTKLNKKMPINDSTTEYYNLKIGNIDLLHFKEIGLWNKKDEIKFYGPKNPNYVSHSALNLRKTEEYFMAKVNRLSELMKSQGYQMLDLLKIDIEGAEYCVIDSIIEDKLKIKAICIEFDETWDPIDKDYLKRIRKSVEKLMKYGYKIVDVDAHHNYTFISDSTYNELIAHQKG